MPPRGARGGGHGGLARRPAGMPKPAHEEGGSERWLVTYADMLTLLLVLFIVLFSISVVNTSKFISLKTSLAGVFGNGSKGIVPAVPGCSTTTRPAPASSWSCRATRSPHPSAVGEPVDGAPTDRAAADPRRRRSGRSPAATPRPRWPRRRPTTRRSRRRSPPRCGQNGMAGSAQFQVTTPRPGDHGRDDGAGVPRQQRRPRTARPAHPGRGRAAAGHDSRDIEVDGYTNQQNVSTDPYPSGWELSSARASAVVRYLAAHGVNEDKLSAVGYSDQHPLYPPSDPRSITLNRRVEIVVLSNLRRPGDRRDAQPAAASPRPSPVRPPADRRSRSSRHARPRQPMPSRQAPAEEEEQEEADHHRGRWSCSSAAAPTSSSSPPSPSPGRRSAATSSACRRTRST